jgi:poly(A) polymerase
LRVYRFFRFSASHGGEMFDAEGLAACRDAVGRLDHISRERVGGEMLRLLALPQVARTLALMAEIGLLALPEPTLRAVLQYETLGGRSPDTRLALLADGDVDRLREAWRLSNAQADTVRAIGASADLIGEGKVAWAAYRFGEHAVEGLAAEASRSGWPRERLMEVARDLGRLEVAPLPVTGKDLLARGMQPGPALGASLEKLERAWVESGFSLTTEELMAKI